MSCFFGCNCNFTLSLPFCRTLESSGNPIQQYSRQSSANGLAVDFTESGNRLCGSGEEGIPILCPREPLTWCFYPFNSFNSRMVPFAEEFLVWYLVESLLQKSRRTQSNWSPILCMTGWLSRDCCLWNRRRKSDR